MLSEPKNNHNIFCCTSISSELQAIADWWKSYSADIGSGGFYGQIDNLAIPNQTANKGVVLNTRILWFFSELAMVTQDASDKATAMRAYEWLKTYFYDRHFGGLFWELDFNGTPVDTKKQIYAQCFGIYSFCSYFKLTADHQALELAKTLFTHVEAHSRDRTKGGYFEACSRDWKDMDDYRLSDKDLNSPKTMNTHLHILEAYSALYTVAPEERIKEALEHVLDVFMEQILGHKKSHLSLFFTADWQTLTQSVSFGHDIEASWLMFEAAQVLGDKSLIESVKAASIRLAESCYQRGLAQAGFVMDEYDPVLSTFSSSSFWWVQAEALVGFVNAFELTGEPRYMEVCQRLWQFICDEHVDNGEWLWLARSQGGQHFYYKAGFWKGPYHNGRAMLELRKRLNKLDM